MPDQFSIWRAERVNPTPEDQRHQRENEHALIGGYWRILSARTKPDYPVLVWRADGETEAVFQIGRKRMRTDTHPDEWRDFTQGAWMHCIAVDKATWASALETGRWPDGKPARQMSAEEKLGIDTGAGDNAAPVEEVLEDQIAALAEKLSNAAVPATQAEADALTGDLDRMRALLKKAGDVREEEFRPHKAAADAVSEKWATIMKPGQDAGTSAEAKRKSYLAKEKKRLDDIAAEENRKREEEARKAAQAERERLQKEADARAAAAGETAVLVAEPEVVFEKVEAKRATAGTSFGRQSGLKKTQVGKIVNLAQLVNALLFDDTKEKDADAMAYFQSRADKAAKGGFPLPGTVIEETYR